MAIRKLLNQAAVIIVAALLGACAGQPPAQPGAKPQESAQPVKVEQVKPEEIAPAKPAEPVQEVATIKAVEVPVETVPVSKAQVASQPAAAPAVPPPAAVKKAAPPEPARAALASKTDPNHFMVVLEKKDQSHPYYGIGDATGFSIDSQQGPELILRRGQSYSFEIHSDPKHDFYITTSELGWGAGKMDEGVTGNLIYEGTLTFVPNEKTPDVVYYQCQNHKAMGNRIFIVDKDAPADLAALRAKHGELPARSAESNQVVSGSEVQKKIAYAKMVATSKGAQRVAGSSNEDAKAMLAEAKQMLTEAGGKLEGGDSAQAMALVDEALRKISAASQLVPSESVQEEQRARYQELQKAVADRKATHARAYERVVADKGKSAGVSYDVAKVDALVASAEQAAAESRYEEAAKSMAEADRLITAAVNEMLHAQTMVYSLNIDTPEGEYDYELKRYQGYADLVPVAVEEKRPNEGQQKLLDGFVTKAEAMRAKAQEYAAANNYPDAIRLLVEATNQVRRGLRLLGVDQ